MKNSSTPDLNMSSISLILIETSKTMLTMLLNRVDSVVFEELLFVTGQINSEVESGTTGIYEV